MNILYIGPYRQIDYVGQHSALHIESILGSLNSSDKLLTRPLYLDTSLVSNKSDNYSTETTVLDTIDVIVQYLPVNFVAIKKNIKNIIIPILNPGLCNITHDYTYKILNYCDKILVEDDKIKNLLKISGIKTSIDIYEESIRTNNLQKFDLDSVEDNYKLGFIGQYQNNKHIINKIIHAFLLASRQNNNLKLYFFLRGSDKDKQELDSIVSNIKKQLHIPEYIDKIYSIFAMWDQKEAITALNSIDCFISLNDDYRYLIYEKFFTKSESSNNRTIINRQNIQAIETPLISINSLYEYRNTVYSINTQDLVSKIINIASSKQKHKTTNYPSLGNIICKSTP